MAKKLKKDDLQGQRCPNCNECNWHVEQGSPVVACLNCGTTVPADEIFPPREVTVGPTNYAIAVAAVLEERMQCLRLALTQIKAFAAMGDATKCFSTAIQALKADDERAKS